MPRLPINPPVRVSPHGAYGFTRKSKADGGCGRSGKYPCTHKGVDLLGKKGTPVFAPEASRVVIAAYDDVTPPLRGYGPGAVMLLGASGLVHILGHLDPEWWTSTPWQIPGVNAPLTEGFIGKDRRPTDGRVYREGEQVGVTSHLNHVHWEMATPRKSPRAGQLAERRDPLVWARGGSASGQSSVLPILLLAALASRRTRA